MSKLLEQGKEARQKLLTGVEKLTKMVAITMGPMGKNVVLGQHIGAPTITKDGVSVARQVVLKDPIEELGCQLAKESAGRSATISGDGTTTSTVLTYNIFKGGNDLINTGYNPLHFRDGINWAKNTLVEELAKLSKPLDTEQEIKNIAIISTNNDSYLGSVIGEAYILAGKTGFVSAEAFPGVKHSVRKVNGLEINSGYVSASFLPKGHSQIDFSDVYIWICDWDVSTIQADTEILRVIQEIGALKKNVLMLCQDIKKGGLAFFQANIQKGILNIVPVKIPRVKNQSKWLEDFASLTSATIIGGDQGIQIEDFKVEHLGYASRVIIDSHQTKFIEPRRNEELISANLKLYQEGIKHLIGDTDRRDLQERIQFLSGNVAVITIGYSTELELREIGDRVDDATSAVKSALEEGYVIGGGFALWRAAQAVENFRLTEVPETWHAAVKALLNSCKSPAQQIIRNAGLDPEEILKNIDENLDFGYNTATGEYGNLIKMGVIDPTKVVRVALENATTISQLLINSDGIVVEDRLDQEGWTTPAGFRLPASDNLNHKH